MGHFWILLVSVIIWHTIHSERTVLQDESKEKRMNVRFSKTSTETLTTGKPRSNSTAPFVTPTLETRTIMAQNSTGNISKSEECLTMKLVNVAFSAGFTIFGITGNTISIRILHKLRTKNSSSLLLSVLAIWDSLTLVIRFSITTTHFLGYYITHTSMQYAGTFIYVYGYPCFQVANCQSTYVILLITVHRFIAICYPHLAAHYCSMTIAKKQLLVVTFAVFLIVLPIFLINEVGSKTGRLKTVYYVEYTSIGQNQIFHIVYPGVIFMVLAFFGPLLVLFVLVVYLIRAVKLANKNRANMSSNPAALQDVTKMLVPVVIVFIVCQIWTRVRRFVEIAQVSFFYNYDQASLNNNICY